MRFYTVQFESITNTRATEHVIAEGPVSAIELAVRTASERGGTIFYAYDITEVKRGPIVTIETRSW